MQADGNIAGNCWNQTKVHDYSLQSAETKAQTVEPAFILNSCLYILYTVVWKASEPSFL